MVRNAIRWMVLLAWLLHAGFFAPHSAGAQISGRSLLPDLQPLAPFDLQLIHHPNGERVLRFSNSVANTGPGPLHLAGEIDPKTQRVTLIQQVIGADDSLQARRRLGGFAYHAEHGHWHWQGFSVYEIWSLDQMAELEAQLVSSGKVGYCMMDVSRASADWLKAQGFKAASPAAWLAYAECGWRRQGISPGWVDTYPRHLPGQSMDVSALADGIYALRTIVDPQELLMEEDTSNNAALVYFHMQGTRLTVLADERFARARIFHDLYGEEAPASSPMPGRAAPCVTAWE